MNSFERIFTDCRREAHSASLRCAEAGPRQAGHLVWPHSSMHKSDLQQTGQPPAGVRVHDRHHSRDDERDVDHDQHPSQPRPHAPAVEQRGGDRHKQREPLEGEADQERQVHEDVGVACDPVVGGARREANRQVRNGDACEDRFGRVWGPFPPAVANRLLLSAPSAAIA